MTTCGQQSKATKSLLKWLFGGLQNTAIADTVFYDSEIVTLAKAAK